MPTKSWGSTEWADWDGLPVDSGQGVRDKIARRFGGAMPGVPEGLAPGKGRPSRVTGGFLAGAAVPSVASSHSRWALRRRSGASG